MLCGGYDSPEAAMLALAVEYGVELPHEHNGNGARRRVSQVSLLLNRSVTPVTPDAAPPLANVRVNESGEAEF